MNLSARLVADTRTAFTAMERQIASALGFISLTRREQVDPGSPSIINSMAWRPYENLIDGELDNRRPGRVTGWLRFFRRGKRPSWVRLDLAGNFHEDIRGKVVRLSNPRPSDRNQDLGRKGTYMEGFSEVQRGNAGDITAGLPLGPWTEQLAQKLMAQNELVWDELGLQEAERARRRQEFAERYRSHIEAGDLYYPYVSYPYLEWYSDDNGRVVLELDASQMEVLDTLEAILGRAKTPRELVEGERRRAEAMTKFMAGLVKQLSEENRKKGGDDTVTGIVVG
jgi:hypothetical protein